MARKKKRRKYAEDRDEQVDQPPLTPFIDVIFQMLIYFMLTMHFKELEGKLLSQLPKDKGLDPSPVAFPELHEVRIYLCVDVANFREHMLNKGRHEVRHFEDPSSYNREVMTALVERDEVGQLYMTEKHPSKARHNRTIYEQVARQTKELQDITPGYWDEAKRAPVILDADSETPYEHVVGVVNACKEIGIDNLEFVGNARFGQFYGSGDQTQWDATKELYRPK